MISPQFGIRRSEPPNLWPIEDGRYLAMLCMARWPLETDRTALEEWKTSRAMIYGKLHGGSKKLNGKRGPLGVFIHETTIDEKTIEAR